MDILSKLSYGYILYKQRTPAEYWVLGSHDTFFLRRTGRDNFISLNRRQIGGGLARPGWPPIAPRVAIVRRSIIRLGFRLASYLARHQFKSRLP